MSGSASKDDAVRIVRRSYANVGKHATSCVECNRRKTKCDRQEPCDQCVRRGVGEKCRMPPERPAKRRASQATTRRSVSSPIVASSSTSSFLELPANPQDVQWRDIVNVLLHSSNEASKKLLFHYFESRWNWTYEVVLDLNDGGINLDPHLLLAIVLVSTMLCEEAESASVYSHTFPKWQHLNILNAIEHAFLECYSDAIRDGINSLSICQSIFIYSVYCKTLAKDGMLMQHHRYDHMYNLLTRSYPDEGVGEDEKITQVRLRLFWNLAGQDINYALASFTKPSIPQLAIHTTPLPTIQVIEKEGQITRYRYVLAHYRAMICLGIVDIAHHIYSGLDPIQDVITRLETSANLLPEYYRFLPPKIHPDRDTSDDLVGPESNDIYLVRTRAIIASLHHKAIESVSRLAMVRHIASPPTEDNESFSARIICAQASGDCIKWIFRARRAARNKGDILCIWQQVMAPSCFLSIATAIADQKRFITGSVSDDAWEWWTECFIPAFIFIQQLYASDPIKLALYKSLFDKVERLMKEGVVDLNKMVKESSTLITREQAKERLSFAHLNDILDGLIRPSCSIGTFTDETWRQIDNWLLSMEEIN